MNRNIKMFQIILQKEDGHKLMILSMNQQEDHRFQTECFDRAAAMVPLGSALREKLSVSTKLSRLYPP